MAARIRHEVEAEGMRLMNEAQNLLTPEARLSAMRIRLIDKLEGIVRESVKPLERIEGIQILQVDGLGGGGGGRGDGGNGGSLADNVVNSALRFRAQAPLVDQLLREIGVDAGDVGKAARGLLDRGQAAALAAGRRGRGRLRARRAAVIKVYVSSVIDAPGGRRSGRRSATSTGCPKWTPFVAESRIEGGMAPDTVGCVRNFRLKDGGVIREQLLTLSDYDFQRATRSWSPRWAWRTTWRRSSSRR